MERDRLLKLDSLTVLDYIRTSIEILMQIKDEGNDAKAGNNKGSNNHGPNLDDLSHGDLNSGNPMDSNR